MSILIALSWFFAAAAVVGIAVSTGQMILTWWYVRRAPAPASSTPGITILKPLCGVDDDLEENLRHFATLPYPKYELLLGVKSEKDPAYAVALAATKRWPDRVRLFLQRGEPGLNPKVNQLITLEQHARYDLMLVSDSNTRTPPGYLEEIAASFEDPQVGCVTNPIVGIGERRLGSLLDNYQMGSNAGPGMIAAKLAPLAPHDIVVGKSMALRRSSLNAMGGFFAARNHLAEDYVLGQGVASKLDQKIVLCRLPVYQVSQDRTVLDFFNRHRRWCVIQRTAIRAYTYFGYGIMAVTPWALAAMVLHPSRETLLAFTGVWLWKSALDATNMRLLRGYAFGWFTPFATLLKDLVWGTAWLYGAFVRTVNWRGNTLRVHHGSQLIPGDLPPSALPAAEPVAVRDDRRVA